jgi:hypothetical protein
MKLSLEEATNLVLDEVVKPDELDHHMIVFSWQEPLAAEDVLHPYQLPGEEAEQIPIKGESWFFWIDDVPVAYYSHPVRYVLVDRATGKVTVHDEDWWPVLNGQGLWITKEEYWNEEYWVFSTIEKQSKGTDASNPYHTPHLAIPGVFSPKNQDRPGAALVVNGWHEGHPVEEEMAADAEGMIDVLNKAGFTTSFLGPPLTSYFHSIEDWVEIQADVLQPSQTAVLYFTSHGEDFGSEGTLLLGRSFFTEKNFAEMLEKFDPGVHIIIIIDACYSGSFVDTLEKYADVTITSTQEGDYAYGDYDRAPGLEGLLSEPDVNPEDEGSEFTSGFVEDWNEIMGDPEEIERIKEKANQRAENFWEALMKACYYSALEKDYAFLNGWTDPIFHKGLPSTRPPTPTPVPPTPTPQPEVSFVEEYQDENLAALDEFAERMGFDEDQKALLVFAYLLDPGGDWIDSIAEQEVGRKEPQVDIIGGSGLQLEMENEEAGQEFRTWIEDNAPCDSVPLQEGGFSVCPGELSLGNTGIPRYGVPKSRAQWSFPVGDTYLFAMTLAGDVPIHDDDHYIYSLVLDADGAPQNNFQAQPPFTWDYYQGTDQWYELIWNPEEDEWSLTVRGPNFSQMESQARVLVAGNLVVFFVPEDEIEVENPSFRLTAFMHDGSFSPAGRGGDVLGENPTQPLFTIPEEPILLEGGGG